VRSVPGEAGAGATVDARERFYGATFAGCGVAWVWAAGRKPVPTHLVRALSAVLLLGGIGRVVSVAETGWPHWFQTVLTGTEFGSAGVLRPRRRRRRGTISVVTVR
jgi:hypothetical protein